MCFSHCDNTWQCHACHRGVTHCFRSSHINTFNKFSHCNVGHTIACYSCLFLDSRDILCFNMQQVYAVSTWWPTINMLGSFPAERRDVMPSCRNVSAVPNLTAWRYLSKAKSSDDLQYFYVTVIRPISEYACTVWNHNLTSTLSDQLESYQKRALRIIYDDQIKGMPYLNILFLANLESLKDRREKISKSFFKKILSSDSCLHSLLPPERDIELLCKLRNPTKYPIPHSRTKRYQSFLNYALAHYQK